jgi:predicted DsbA family dithiol-disulfide isomerase
MIRQAISVSRHDQCLIQHNECMNGDPVTLRLTGSGHNEGVQVQMIVEIWSDYMCPFCYIGKRHFENALAEFPHRDGVEVVWRSFQLNPDAAVETGGDLHDYVASKFGRSRAQAKALNDQMVERAAAAGLRYDLDAAHPTNSFDAHRFTHLAASHGLQDAAEERLMAAHFTEGQNIGRYETLRTLGGEIGLDPTDVAGMLTGGAYADEVRADVVLAREFGISGVPFFIFDRRYAVSGAQPPEVFARALAQAWEDLHPVSETTTETIATGDACDDASAAAATACAVPTGAGAARP